MYFINACLADTLPRIAAQPELVQFSREASKDVFSPQTKNQDYLGVQAQFGFATRFKCFLSLPSAVSKYSVRVFLNELQQIFEKYDNEYDIKIDKKKLIKQKKLTRIIIL